MPDKNEHVAKAEHNRAFWKSHDLDSTSFLDWVVTGIFYESVHWIEAYLSTCGEHSGGHPERLRGIRRHTAAIGAIRADYGLLKTESENTRYLCHKPKPEDIKNELMPVLDRIRAIIQPLVR